MIRMIRMKKSPISFEPGVTLIDAKLILNDVFGMDIHWNANRRNLECRKNIDRTNNASAAGAVEAEKFGGNRNNCGRADYNEHAQL